MTDPNHPVVLDIPDLIIKRCSTVLVPIPTKYIFNISVSRTHFPNLMEASSNCACLWQVKVPVYTKTYLYLYLMTLQCSLNLLCFTTCVFISYANWIPVKMASFDSNLLLPTAYRTQATYIYVSPLDCSQGQVNAMYFEAPPLTTCLIHPFYTCPVPTGCQMVTSIGWVVAELLPYSSVRIHGIQLIPLEVLPGVPQGPLLGPLLFSVFINDFCNSIEHSRYCLFADDITVSRTVSSALLPPNIDAISAAKCMTLNTGNTRVIAFTRKTKVINYNYKPATKKTRSNSAEDLTVLCMLNSHFTTMSTAHFLRHSKFWDSKVRWPTFFFLHCLQLTL